MNQSVSDILQATLFPRIHCFPGILFHELLPLGIIIMHNFLLILIKVGCGETELYLLYIEICKSYWNLDLVFVEETLPLFL